MQAQDEQLLQAVRNTLQQEHKFQQLLQQAKVSPCLYHATLKFSQRIPAENSLTSYRDMQQLKSTRMLSSRRVFWITWSVPSKLSYRCLIVCVVSLLEPSLSFAYMQLASGAATYICNTAFAATERLHSPYNACPRIPSGAWVHSIAEKKQLHLQGLPLDSLHKAKQAWQKLLVERLQYLQ